jgi:hypothetical protein
MNIQSLLSNGCVAAVLVALPALTFAAPKKGETPETGAVSVMKNLWDTAVKTAQEASEIQSMARNVNTSWEAHAAHWQLVRDDVNRLGEELDHLKEVRGQLDPDEAKIVDRIYPVLKSMADNTQAAILFLNQQQQHLWLGSYQTYVANLADEADQLSKTVGEYVRLAKARNNEKHIETILGSAE